MPPDLFDGWILESLPLGPLVGLALNFLFSLVWGSDSVI